MVSNYNYTLDLWRQRNRIDKPIKEKILAQFPGQAYVNMNPEMLSALVGAAELSVLIDLTERVIKLNDDLIIEIDDFLENFRKRAKILINTKRLKRYGSLLKYSNNGNKNLLDLLKRTPEVNFNSVENLFGKNIRRIKTDAYNWL